MAIHKLTYRFYGLVFCLLTFELPVLTNVASVKACEGSTYTLFLVTFGGVMRTAVLT